MKFETFFENFELLTDAPNGVAKLREIILQFALMGKLVKQNSNDEQASVLLKNIREEKQQFIREKKLTKDKLISQIEPDEILYQIPSNWIWVRLPEVCLVITDGEHITPKYTDSGVPMLSAKHIGQKELIFEDFKYVSEDDAQKFWSRCNPDIGDILVVSRGAGIGRAIISNHSQYCLMGSVLLFKLSKFYVNKFLLYFLLSSVGNKTLRTASATTAQQAIYIAHLKRDYLVPLPPLEEQKQIVEKCDRLMSLCDTLEAKLKQGRESSEKLMEVAARQVLAN